MRPRQHDFNTHDKANLLDIVEGGKARRLDRYFLE
jgi:hypothetical protein